MARQFALCEIEPTLRGILSVDFRQDFEMPFRQLMQALDLPRREFSDRYPNRDEADFDLRDRRLDSAERGRRSYSKGKRFEDEVATLYELLGWKIARDIQVSGVQIDLMIEKRDGGLLTQAVVECKNKRITADERNQILAQQNIIGREMPRHRWIAVSSEGFAADTRAALERAGIDCTTYNGLLNEIVSLDRYVESLRGEYEDWVNDEKRWQGDRHRFIPPKLQADRMRDKIIRLLRPELTDEEVISTPVPALEYLGRWLGDQERNLLVILGDLGTGKTTLAQYVTDRLAEIHQSDAQRHPAPVLIPLRDVRKQTSLEGIVHAHFARYGLSDLKFRHFEQLVRQGKVILVFDAFDEMADRVNWDITIGNFTELTRCADLRGKVILTCRTHYFKDRKEQIKIIGELRSTEIETALYQAMGRRSDADVVYLLEFDDEQIQAYIRRVCGEAKADEYWHTIENTYNLEDLSKRPLLLDMIVKTLPELERRGGAIDTYDKELINFLAQLDKNSCTLLRVI